MQCLARCSSSLASRPLVMRAAAPAARSVHGAQQQARRSLMVRAETSSTEPTTVDVEKLVKDVQDKWDKVENKTQLIVYGSSAIVTLWLANTIVNAVNGVPLLPKLFELVGLGYSSWFVYRYLLFKSSREELLSDIDELKKKIAGTED